MCGRLPLCSACYAAVGSASGIWGTKMISHIVKLATKLFAALAFLLAALLAATLLYHLGVVGEAGLGQGAVHWFFVPGWEQVLALAMLIYLGCLVVAWLYVRVRHDNRAS